MRRTSYVLNSEARWEHFAIGVWSRTASGRPARAKALEQELRRLPQVSEVLPVETNIVIVRLAQDISVESFLRQLQNRGVRALGMGGQLVRFVFHLDVTDAHMEVLRRALLQV